MNGAEPEPFWVKSNWSVDDLDGKWIEFQFPLRGGGIASGLGPMMAHDRPSVDDLISIRIEIDESAGPMKRRQTVFRLSQREADQIEKHSDSETADFRLVLP